MPASSAAWMVPTDSASSAGPYMPDMPMAPRPRAGTVGPVAPRRRVGTGMPRGFPWPARLAREGGPGRQAPGERRGEAGGLLDVRQVDHLDGRVHVAQRQPEPAAGDAAAADVEGVEVRP